MDQRLLAGDDRFPHRDPDSRRQQPLQTLYYMYDRKIHSLEREIKAYREEIKINSEKLNNLRTDKEGLERFAREEYLMKRENEDIYIIKSK